MLIAGVAAGVATKQYGLLTGYALPLLTLPSFITYSLSTALVPAISEANALRNDKLVEHRLQLALKFALLSGGLAVIILYIFAEPLMTVMYGSANGSEFIRLIAPFFIFHYYQGPLQAILQALDLARAAMMNSLIGNTIKIAVIFVLTSRPEFGINGAALGIATGTVLITMLHYATVLKRVQFTVYIRDYVKFIVAACLAGYSGVLLYTQVFNHLHDLLRLLLGIVMTSLLYIILIFSFRLLHKSDLARFSISSLFK
ncbi:polysaccharide biosynthesis C-terminal domain-containing protein [Bacillus sp. N9]